MSRSEDAEVVRFRVRVQPRASRNEVAGRHGDAIKVRISSPPVDGAANAALVAFLAQVLGVPARSVCVAHGERGRDKVIEVTTVDAEPVRRRLDALMNGES